MTKILFLAANPADTNELQLQEESRAIDQSLRMAAFRDSFDIRSHWAVHYADLPELLMRYEPDIVHFSGHGSSTGEIILDEGNGRGHPVSPQALSRLFTILKDNIRCVVLNACFSQIQAEAIAEHIDCVVGMNKAISDTAAIDFAAAFYQGLGFGRSVQTAFDLACNRIDLANLAEQDTPQLLARRANPRQVMLVKSAPADEPKSAQQSASAEDSTRSSREQPSGSSQVVFQGPATFESDFAMQNIYKTDQSTKVAHDLIVDHGAVATFGSQNVHVETRLATDLSAAQVSEVQRLIEQLREQLAQAEIPETKKIVGQEYIQQLGDELVKTADRPDPSIIKVAGEWLLKNVPTLAGTLTSVFLNPIVGKVVAAAGDIAAEWVKARFDSLHQNEPQA